MCLYLPPFLSDLSIESLSISQSWISSISWLYIILADESLQFSKQTNYARKLNKTTYVFDCSVNDYDPVSGDIIW